MLKDYSVVEIEARLAQALSDLSGEPLTVSIGHVEFSSDPMDALVGKTGVTSFSAKVERAPRSSEFDFGSGLGISEE